MSVFTETRTWLLKGLCFALMSSCGGLQQAPDYSKTETAFVGVNVIPMAEETVDRDQTVLVAEGKILAIGDAGDITVPEGAVKIDGRNRFLLPGLAEMHAHIPAPREGEDDRIVEETLFLYLSNGITTIRGMLGHPSHLAVKEAVESGEILGPRIYTSGPSLNGRSVTSKEVARTMVREQKEAGYDFLKLHPGLSLELFNEIVSVAKEVGIGFAGHVSTDVGIHRAIEAGYATIDHLDGYLEGLVQASANVEADQGGFFGFNFTDLADPSQISDLASKTKRANVWVVPTQSLLERMISPEGPAIMAQESEMRFVSQNLLKRWVDRKKRLQTGSNYSPDQAEKYISLRRQIIKGLHQAGVGLLLGSDAPQVFNVPGFSIHHELAMLVASGLTPFEALRTGTSNPAVFFEAEGEYGVIKPAAAADFILLNENPLQDVAHLRNRVAVMVRGKWLPEEEIQMRLDEVASKYVTLK